MTKKLYKHSDNKPGTVSEPAAVYHRTKSPNVADWDPNTPVHATQEEWWEHFHKIEEGHFMSLEEFDRKFEAWKKQYLANKLK